MAEVESVLRQEHIDALNAYVTLENELKELTAGFVGQVSPGQTLPPIIVTEELLDKWERLQAERDGAFERYRESGRRYFEHLRRTRGQAR